MSDWIAPGRSVVPLRVMVYISGLEHSAARQDQYDYV